MSNENGYMWRVLNSKRHNGSKIKQHKLKRGDVIKLGRYIFEIKEISSQSEFKAGMLRK